MIFPETVNLCFRGEAKALEIVILAGGGGFTILRALAQRSSDRLIVEKLFITFEEEVQTMYLSPFSSFLIISLIIMFAPA